MVKNVQHETLAQPYEFTANIDERNRITIPAEIASVLNIKKGDKVTVKLTRTHRIVRGFP